MAISVRPLDLTVNGSLLRLEVDPRTTLLDLLREKLELTRAKKGCNRGECGACTVHLDGRRVNACMVLALSCSGREVGTIEGLAEGDHLHAVQAAFIEHDAFQCGFCTPGQVMSAVACIREGHIFKWRLSVRRAHHVERGGRTSGCRPRTAGPEPGDLEGGIRASAQPRHDRRQSIAAHALRVLLPG